MNKFCKIIGNKVNEPVEVIIYSQGSFIEIWQGSRDAHLIEFEYELIPDLVVALLEAYQYRKDA